MRSLHHQFNFDNYSIENLASNEWPIGGLIGLWKNRIDVTARITGACLSERPASSFAGGAVKLHQSIVECWTGAGFPFLLAVVHLFTFLFILPVISAHFFFILGFYYDFLLLYSFFRRWRGSDRAPVTFTPLSIRPTTSCSYSILLRAVIFSFYPARKS